MELVQIYFKKLNKVAVISNFLAFFQFLVDKFTLLDPDPHIECGSGSRRENECGSIQIRIHSPGFLISFLERTERISFRNSSVLSKVEPEPGPRAGSRSQTFTLAPPPTKKYRLRLVRLCNTTQSSPLSSVSQKCCKFN